MTSKTKIIGLALVCSDGRLHRDEVHYNQQLAQALKVDLLDVVAVPGPDGLFKPGREGELDAALAQMKLLIEAHDPAALAIVGHYTCAGNPGGDADHDADAMSAAQKFKTVLKFEQPVLAFSTVLHPDETWSLKVI